jgi:hypothetical protein
VLDRQVIAWDGSAYLEMSKLLAASPDHGS